MMNKITNILGVLLIIAASYSVFALDKVTWFDAMWGIVSGISLIYTKNSSFSSNVLSAIKKNG